MENIILVAHGSRKEGAIDLASISESLHRIMHPGCNRPCIKIAYLQFNRPDLESTIEECVRSGSESVIVHPFFLGSGMHVTQDIPEILLSAKERYPKVNFLYTKPLGDHEFVLRGIWARIQEAMGLSGQEIERQSMELIEGEVDLSGFEKDEIPIVKRVIHATADPQLGLSMRFSPRAVEVGIEALRRGKRIVTDVKMVKAGINRARLEALGVEVVSSMELVEEIPPPTDKTRAQVAMARAFSLFSDMGILAIGNAPTALLGAMELIDSGFRPPDLLIGVPVGFVNALESKLILSKKPYPFITNINRKGGSPVAVAIINALLRLAKGGEDV
ncbi:MAG: precorrin-8X methylmutase [Desulfatiglandales bacterium]